MIKMKIERFVPDVHCIIAVIKVKKIKDSDIRNYMKVDKYYPIIYKYSKGHYALHENTGNRNLNAENGVFSWSEIENVYASIKRYVEFDIITNFSYDHEKSQLHIAGEYCVDLI